MCEFYALGLRQQENVLKNLVFEFTDIQFDERSRRAVVEFDLDANPRQCLWFQKLIREAAATQDAGDDEPHSEQR